MSREFLVELVLAIPDGTPAGEVERRIEAEAVAAARLAREGHLVRLWRPAVGEAAALGIFRAADRDELDGILAALPLGDWFRVTVTPLDPHPNDPAPAAGQGP